MAAAMLRSTAGVALRRGGAAIEMPLLPGSSASLPAMLRGFHGVVNAGSSSLPPSLPAITTACSARRHLSTTNQQGISDLETKKAMAEVEDTKAELLRRLMPTATANKGKHDLTTEELVSSLTQQIEQLRAAGAEIDTDKLLLLALLLNTTRTHKDIKPVGRNILATEYVNILWWTGVVGYGFYVFRDLKLPKFFVLTL